MAYTFEEELDAWKTPAGVGGTGAGASIFGTAALSCAPFRTAGLDLSRSREADVWRADYAVLLHLRLQII